MVFRRCRMILQNDEDAFDAMQFVFEIFIKIAGKKKINNMTSYFYKMAANHSLNILKKEKRINRNLKIIDYLSTDNLIEERLVNKELLEAILKRTDEATRVISSLPLLTHSYL